MNEQMAKNYFRGFSPKGRASAKKHFEKLLAINAGTYKLKLNNPMPLMQEAWEKGLALLKEVMAEKGELQNELTAERFIKAAEMLKS